MSQILNHVSILFTLKVFSVFFFYSLFLLTRRLQSNQNQLLQFKETIRDLKIDYAFDLNRKSKSKRNA